MSKRRVLILCTGNSCRSQIAEALWRHLAGDEWDVHSAGSHPVGFVHPLAVQALAELGLDVGDQHSKALDRYLHQQFDLVVTVCDRAAQDCPTFTHARRRIHWPLDDPASAGETELELASAFRHTRDEVRARIAAFLEADREGRASPETR